MPSRSSSAVIGSIVLVGRVAEQIVKDVQKNNRVRRRRRLR
jgi:hypothetical protein